LTGPSNDSNLEAFDEQNPNINEEMIVWMIDLKTQ
jgi:hypothetical protein